MDWKYASLALSAAFLVAACGTSELDNDASDAATTDTAMSGTDMAETADEAVPEMRYSLSVEEAVAGDWRTDEEKARDAFRNPVETLTFFEIAPDATVIEMWPGGGWYSDIIGAYLNAGGGEYIVAHIEPTAFGPANADRIAEGAANLMTNFAENEAVFGTVEQTVFGPTTDALAEPESVDAIVTFRSVHGWMRTGIAAKFFDDAHAALKPGGTLGVVQHRLPSTATQDPAAMSGYVHEDVVIGLAEAAGFTLAGSSEINANPADTADHPLGVWTLPPVNRRNDELPADFDDEAYRAIGESNRMTLRFIKAAE